MEENYKKNEFYKNLNSSSIVNRNNFVLTKDEIRQKHIEKRRIEAALFNKIMIELFS